jgi:hypothetical protein
MLPINAMSFFGLLTNKVDFFALTTCQMHVKKIPNPIKKTATILF